MAPAHPHATGVAVYPALLTGHSVAHYIRSLTRSAVLRFATLASLARFIHRLSYSLYSLMGTVEIRKYVFTLKTLFTETLEILVDNRNTPSI